MGPSSGVLLKCGICEIQDRKYKCPTCYVPYCSSSCFGSHICVPYVPPKENSNPKKSTIFQENNSTVDLTALGKSDPLKTLLKSSPCLRDLLERVNTTHNPEGFMKLVMREPIFVEFADLVLDILDSESEKSS
ncbi:ZNHIT3 [Lepeophtheirus salmonis]|uniref:ZNHIT3 n=1 Tax=Lepeophtheirus salmonis TaxID=72036 RepID=A0A7R8H1G4_LEPSM|nr:zinc finger HIT domain-containing protein 3-like [Lepeophtheirus salmonis]CAB4057006.1 ZNHIT3 [Lepeophtheirus salmonis]CAF2809064.1 ZNHIT3 [Lepeophtheirus salmonis]